jgi:hypothetical protein
MLPKSKKQKGKHLEKWVAGELKKIFGFVYSRADSGSGKFHKEDITLPDEIPFHIECKNQKDKNLKEWWKQTYEACASSKIPVLIYKLNYQKVPTVVMNAADFLDFLSGNFKTRNVDFMENWKRFSDISFLIEFSFSDFFNILKYHYKEKYKIE